MPLVESLEHRFWCHHSGAVLGAAGTLVMITMLSGFLKSEIRQRLNDSLIFCAIFMLSDIVCMRNYVTCYISSKYYAYFQSAYKIFPLPRQFTHLCHPLVPHAGQEHCAASTFIVPPFISDSRSSCLMDRGARHRTTHVPMHI